MIVMEIGTIIMKDRLEIFIFIYLSSLEVMIIFEFILRKLS